LQTIFKRTVSQFRFSIQNQNSTTAARLASFSKNRTKIGSSSVDFCQIRRFAPHFDENCLMYESGLVFEIKIQTIVAQTATILVSLIVCTL
jgi:hypothetical protein